MNLSKSESNTDTEIEQNSQETDSKFRSYQKEHHEPEIQGTSQINQFAVELAESASVGEIFAQILLDRKDIV